MCLANRRHISAGPGGRPPGTPAALIGVEFKPWGRDTGGAVSIVEHPFVVGALVPPHLHTREDEYSIVTEGQVYLIAEGPPQSDDVLALAGKYGLQFGRPDWLPGLISRYGLTPLPG